MFDCVLPTRNARNGWLFTATATSRSATPLPRDTRALDATALLHLRAFSRSYLHHLQKVNEILGARLTP